VSTLVYRFEEIAPRPLRPEVYELDGISRASVEAHYKLYEGYVAKRNEILRRLADVDATAARDDWGFAPKYDFARAFSEYLIPTIRSRYA